MARQLKAGIDVSTSAMEARLKAIDKQAAKRDAKIKTLQGRLKDSEKRAGNLGRRIGSLGSQVRSAGISTAVALGAEELFEALGIRENRIGRLGSSFATGFSTGGIWGGIGGLITGGFAEIAREYRQQRELIKRLEADLVAIKTEIARDRETLNRAIQETRADFLLKLDKTLAKIRAEADDLYYSTAYAFAGSE